MNLRQKIDFNLYLITDRKLFTDNSLLFSKVEEALKAGVKAVQLREKDLGIRELLDMAYKMRELTKKHRAKLFINDRVDVALAVEADGVHLGGQSIPLSAARKIAQNKLMIGVSTHSIDEAVNAEKQGADFVILGPIYETQSKLEYGKPLGIDILNKAEKKVSIPVFAIGGIKADRVKEVISAGADGVAVISAILNSKNVQEDTEKFLRLLK